MHTVIQKWVNNKVLLCSTGNYIQCPVINHDGTEYETNVYVCIPESPCSTVEINKHCGSTIHQ